MRNFSRFSFLRRPKKGISAARPATARRGRTEYRRKPCCEKRSRISVSVAASATCWWISPRVSAYLRTHSAILLTRLHDFGSRWNGELEKLVGDRWIEALGVEGEIEHGAILPGDLQLLDFKGGRHQEFHFGIRQVGRPRIGRDSGAAGHGHGFNVLEFLLEIEFAEQESQGCSHVLGLFQTPLLDPPGTRQVEVNDFAIGDEKLAGGRRILPAHTAGLAEKQRTGFGFGCPA